MEKKENIIENNNNNNEKNNTNNNNNNNENNNNENNENNKNNNKINNKNTKNNNNNNNNIIEFFIGKSYTQIGHELTNSHENIFKTILQSRSIPEKPLNSNTINYILTQISNMDSNNGPFHIGIGEREGRILSSLVHQRNYGLVHGMGRSGNINDLQPKAVGSSLLVQLTISMTKNLLHSIGMTFIKDLLILPFATGMAMTISFLTLRILKPKAKFIIWSRIDQKTCFKCIITSGFIPIIIDPIIKNNDYELSTNIEKIISKIKEIGKENILCVFSTTSCFAPRNYDDIENLSILCKENDIFHVVNNAYGIQCSKIVDILNKSCKIGKVDLIVSSTDKNFLVPVGGSLIYSNNEKLIEKVKKNYPGRASISPLIDLFITFLESGKEKIKFLIKDRKEKYNFLCEKFKKIAEKYDEKMLIPKNNKISIGFTLKNVVKKAGNLNEKKDITEIGAMFFNRQISGVRIIARNENETEISGYKFKNYGCSCDEYKYLPYMTFACAIGITNDEVENFCKKFEKIIDEFIKNKNKNEK